MSWLEEEKYSKNSTRAHTHTHHRSTKQIISTHTHTLTRKQWRKCVPDMKSNWRLIIWNFYANSHASISIIRVFFFLLSQRLLRQHWRYGICICSFWHNFCSDLNLFYPFGLSVLSVQVHTNMNGVCVCVVSFFFILLLLVSIHLFFCLLIHRIFASAGGISDSFPLKPFSLLFLSPQLRIIDFCSNCVWWNLLLFFCCCSPWMCSPSYQTSIIRMKIIFLLNNNPRITMDNKTTETEYTKRLKASNCQQNRI